MPCTFFEFLDAVILGDVVKLIMINWDYQYLNKFDNNGDTNQGGFSSLHYAAYKGHCDMITYLLDQGANVNIKSPAFFTSPLSVAAFNNKIQAMELLLNRGANIEVGGIDEGSPLCDAVRGGHIDAIAFLLRKGANPGSCDRNGFTPLHLVACSNDLSYQDKNSDKLH